MVSGHAPFMAHAACGGKAMPPTSRRQQHGLPMHATHHAADGLHSLLTLRLKAGHLHLQHCQAAPVCRRTHGTSASKRVERR